MSASCFCKDNVILAIKLIIKLAHMHEILNPKSCLKRKTTVHCNDSKKENISGGNLQSQSVEKILRLI